MLTLNSAAATTATPVCDCWNKTGVYGDSSCPKLRDAIHCRNCPAWFAAAAELLDVDLSADHLRHRTEQVAEAATQAQPATHSALVFRVGAESLALPATVLQEVVTLRPVHSLPHRRNGVILGLANIRGELLVCFSLQQTLGLDSGVTADQDARRIATGRLLVLQGAGGRAVCPVDGVTGLARFHPRDLAPVPATVGKAAATYTRAILSWQEQSVGLLDEQLLLHTVERSLA